MNYRERFEQWKTDDFFDMATRRELSSLTDEKEIEDRFYQDLEFGTGGLRGVMGAGTNRMNKYTVGKATTGLGKYLLTAYGADVCKERGVVVVIGYDTRNNSNYFAMIAAHVLSGMGIKVFLHAHARPTPQLSFSVEFWGTVAGIVITASHNPKEYNGYKVYDEYGCQLVPSQAKQVIAYVDAVDDYHSINFEGNEELIAVADLTDNFINAVQKQSRFSDKEGRNPRGKEYSVDAICGYVTLLRLAFEEAYKDDMIAKNPFDFSVRRLLHKEEDKPRVITEEQYQELMEFLVNDKIYSDLYYPLALAHETGLRAGEVIGLTVDDIDFQNQVLHVSRQIVFGPGRTYCITGPKSKAGNRYVPLSLNAMQILHAAIEDVKARKVNPCIDGIVGFLLIRKNCNVYVSEVYCDRARRAMEKYRKINPNFPHFKSHMLRHMFCDNLNESGISIKTAQYIMCHAKADTTANIYMQANRENAIDDYRNKFG